MKHAIRFLLILALLLCVTGCGMAEDTIDYAASITLDMASETAKAQVSVQTFVDGDTVHFHVPADVEPSGVLKARFLAINTPESTGKIEEYGKKASAFTREKLSAATSILIESDDSRWNLDSTGGRYLVWVWYKTAENDEYRNLNIEILQNGLAIANASKQNRYGDLCMAAISQAREQKLNVYSGQPDPDFFYGDALEVTAKELRLHPEQYNGKKVAFKGVITMNHNNAVYVEDYDAETGMYFGMQVYYGFNLSGGGMDILSVGNEARIVGTMQYYEAGDAWQVSGLTYRMMKPDDPGNIQKISEGHKAAYVLTPADTLVNGSVTLRVDDSEETHSYADLAQATSVEMRNLRVKKVRVAKSGAVTLVCESDGIRVQVHMDALSPAEGGPVTQDMFQGKTIDVKGVVDSYDGKVQIEVLSLQNITMKD